jgi:uncharacterized protein
MPYKTPGVYKEEIFLQPETRLPTGVPGFLGFAEVINAPSGNPGFNQPFVLHRKQEFTAQFRSPSNSYLAEAVNGFFENGGIRCYVVCVDPASGAETADTKTAWQAALKALETLDDLDLVAVPDVMTLSNGNAIVGVQRAVLIHCAALGNRMAILDALPNSSTKTVIEQRDQLRANLAEPINGALYYPWLKNTQDYPVVGKPGQVEKGRLVPPCGHIAGIIARTDRSRGVFKAPANEVIRDALDLEFPVDNSIQDQLNPKGINGLRAFPGRGIRVWGARTLNQDPNWRYIGVRRLFLTLGRWIDQNLIWATFEPSSPRLWIRIQRELSTVLTELWRLGALQGATAEQAFYVKCDAETNPSERREAGEVVTEIGLAASATAEFIVVRIVHRASTAEVSSTV